MLWFLDTAGSETLPASGVGTSIRDNLPRLRTVPRIPATSADNLPPPCILLKLGYGSQVDTHYLPFASSLISGAWMIFCTVINCTPKFR
jgi:hypothetical protein